MALGLDSASKRNEYQEYFLRGKGGTYVGLTTLPPSCARLSWNLGASTSWNPQGPSRVVMGLICLHNKQRLFLLTILSHLPFRVT
jgi:hypothetical protein